MKENLDSLLISGEFSMRDPNEFECDKFYFMFLKKDRVELWIEVIKGSGMYGSEDEADDSECADVSLSNLVYYLCHGIDIFSPNDDDFINVDVSNHNPSPTDKVFGIYGVWLTLWQEETIDDLKEEMNANPVFAIEDLNDLVLKYL